MIRTRLLRSLIAATLLAIVPATTVAATKTTTLSPAVQAQRLATLKTKGAAEIARRTAALTATEVALGTTKKLNTADKAVLTKQIQDEIAGLTGLGTKLAAETTLEAARVDMTSITSDFRVYALMLPKVRLVVAADQTAAIADQLTTLQGKLETKIASEKAAGSDVSAMETSLIDMKAKLTAAGTSTEGLAAKLVALQPTDYNSDHAVLVGYRAILTTARGDLRGARDDAANIIAALKK